MNILNILKFAHKGVKSYPAKLGRAGRSAFALYAALVLCVLCFAAPAFAADDPLAIVNNRDMPLYIYIGSARGERSSRALFFFLEGFC